MSRGRETRFWLALCLLLVRIDVSNSLKQQHIVVYGVTTQCWLLCVHWFTVCLLRRLDSCLECLQFNAVLLCIDKLVE
jgi:hypothetical protein